MTPKERERLIERALARYRELLRQRLTDEPQTLDEIEQTVAEIGQVMDQELECRFLEPQEQPQIPEENQAACPQVGCLGRYRATEERQLITRRGEHTLARRRYYCRPCGEGTVPAASRHLHLLREATCIAATLLAVDFADARLDGATYDGLTRWPTGFDPQATGVRLG